MSKLFSSVQCACPGVEEARRGEGKQGLEIRRLSREGTRSVGARLLPGAAALSLLLRPPKKEKREGDSLPGRHLARPPLPPPRICLLESRPGQGSYSGNPPRSNLGGSGPIKPAGEQRSGLGKYRDRAPYTALPSFLRDLPGNEV